VPPGHYLVELLRVVNPGNVEERMALRDVTVTAS